MSSVGSQKIKTMVFEERCYIRGRSDFDDGCTVRRIAHFGPAIASLFANKEEKALDRVGESPIQLTRFGRKILEIQVKVDKGPKSIGPCPEHRSGRHVEVTACLQINIHSPGDLPSGTKILAPLNPG